MGRRSRSRLNEIQRHAQQDHRDDDRRVDYFTERSGYDTRHHQDDREWICQESKQLNKAAQFASRSKARWGQIARTAVLPQLVKSPGACVPFLTISAIL